MASRIQKDVIAVNRLLTVCTALRSRRGPVRFKLQFVGKQKTGIHKACGFRQLPSSESLDQS
eukprot:2866183-Rhodomonas_salina.1